MSCCDYFLSVYIEQFIPAILSDIHDNTTGRLIIKEATIEVNRAKNTPCDCNFI